MSNCVWEGFNIDEKITGKLKTSKSIGKPAEINVYKAEEKKHENSQYQKRGKSSKKKRILLDNEI